jgi:3-oxoacyl-[acyl-carrier protein] reductase
MNRLEGRYALITGAARGIGRAIARALSHEGAHIAINYQTSETDAASLAEELAKAGRQSLLLRGDVGERSTWDSMLKVITKTWRRLDILFNNAGIPRAIRVCAKWPMMTGSVYCTPILMPVILVSRPLCR